MANLYGVKKLIGNGGRCTVVVAGGAPERLDFTVDGVRDRTFATVSNGGCSGKPTANQRQTNGKPTVSQR